MRILQTNISEPLINLKQQNRLIIDFFYLLLKTSICGYQNTLAVPDHFSPHAVAVPTRYQTAKTTADVFFNNFIYYDIQNGYILTKVQT